MSSVFTKTRLRRRLFEIAGWTAGIAASVGLATGVYTLAAAPFTSFVDDETALPKELATTTERVPVPLPAVLSPNAAPAPGAPVLVAPASAPAPAAPVVVTTAPQNTQPQSPQTQAPAPAPSAPEAAPASAAPGPAPQPEARSSAPASTQAPRRSPQTQPPRSTQPPATQAPSRDEDTLAPIFDPVTGLVRGNSSDQDEQ